MTDDEGVLENLPRSRPGRRSEKRGPKPAAAPRRVAGAAAGEQQEPPARADRDPVGDAVRTVTSVAATGARVANGLARELLKRLPRP